METKAYPSNTYRTSLLDDLILEILLRLPVKSLLRFKSVCKSWYSLIKNPNFAMINLQFNRNHSSSHLLIRSDDTMFTLHLDLTNLDDYESNTEMKGKFLPISPKFLTGALFENNELSLHRDFRIIGSCNGLICIHFFNQKYIYIWNPTINEYRAMLPPYKNAGWSSWLCICGFGYVSSTNDYKIVLITERKIEYKCHIFAQVYSLRQNMWREIENFEQLMNLSRINIISPMFYGLKTRFKEAVLLNDSMYWYSYQHKDCFIKFDMVKETFERVGDQDERKFLYCTEIGVTGDENLFFCETTYACKNKLHDLRKEAYVVKFWVLDQCINTWKMKLRLKYKPIELGFIGYDKTLLRMSIGNTNVLIYEIDFPDYMAMESLIIVYAPKSKGKSKISYIQVKNKYCAPYKSGVDVVGVVNYVSSLISPNSI